MITDSHVSDTLRHAIIDLWTIILQLTGISPLPRLTLFVYPDKRRQQQFINNEFVLQLMSTSQWRRKILNFLDEPSSEKQKEDVVLFNGFRGINNWRPNRNWFPIQRYLRRRRRPRTNQTNNTPKNPKSIPPTKFLYHGGQRTIRNTNCNNWIAIRSRWYHICRAFHNHGQIRQSLNRTLLFAAQRHSIGYETKSS